MAMEEDEDGSAAAKKVKVTCKESENPKDVSLPSKMVEPPPYTDKKVKEDKDKNFPTSRTEEAKVKEESTKRQADPKETEESTPNKKLKKETGPKEKPLEIRPDVKEGPVLQTTAKHAVDDVKMVEVAGSAEKKMKSSSEITSGSFEEKKSEKPLQSTSQNKPKDDLKRKKPRGGPKKEETSKVVDPVEGAPKVVDPGEGTSKTVNPGEGTSKEDFTKPGQVRKRVRRNTPRQKAKNGRGKFLRKRSHGGLSVFKRRKKELGVIVPPTKFLLGGNINDPLNLNSLQDEEINRAMNAVTPKSSPLPTPKHRRGEVEVILPRNLKDPLHLTSGTDDVEYIKLLSKKKRKRKRKRGNSGSGSGKEESFEPGVPSEEPSATIEGAFVPPDSLPAGKREALTLSIKEAPKRRKPEGLDKIVSPVVPQPGAWKRGQPRPGVPSRKRKPAAATPNFNPRNARYQYGNYDRYYGYRNPNRDSDLRLQCFVQHQHLFVDKDVLDIGCNIGHVTLCVARDLGARSVVGLDIDKRLIGIARKNVKHYVTVAETPVYSSCPSAPMLTPRTPHPQLQDSPANQQSPYAHPYSPVNQSPFPQPVPSSPANQQSPCPHQHSPADRSPFPHQYVPNSPAYLRSPCPQQNSPASRSPFPNPNSPANPSPMPLSPVSEQPESLASTAPQVPHPSFFPISMPILYGPLDLPGFATPEGGCLSSRPFPHNVSFIQGSYVLESEALLTTETPQFDVILCLSVTKWIHLNWGDTGLKRAFRRMFAQLRPGGKLILEPQGWPSYNRKKTLTEQIYRNYMSIELLPEKFIEYLLSPAVGFSTVEEIGAPAHRSKGFRRPIHVLTKPGQTPSSCNTPVSYTPYSQRTCVRKPVYTSLGAETFDTEEDKKK